MSDRSETPSIIVPLTVATGVFMEGLDSTIIATSVPQMAESLGVSPTHLSLAITSYLLALAVFTPLTGWLADRVGPRRMYCWAIVIFTISSALCGLATNLAFMVAMRALQGLGGAMLNPVARLILMRTFPKSMYIAASNYMALPGLIGPMIGPVIGGFITSYFSWRWIFLVNIPIGIIGLILTLRLIKEIPTYRSPPFDFPGFVLISGGFTMFQIWMESLGRHLIALSTQIVLFVGSVVALLLYGPYARRRVDAVVDLKLFRIPTFSVSVLWGSIARMGVHGTPFLLPLLFQLGFGFDPFHAGVLMLVTICGSFFMRLGFAPVMRALGLRRVLILNSVIVALLLFGFVFFHATSPHWLLVVYLFAFGFLRSVQFLTLNMLAYADLTPEMMARATTVFTLGQRLSMSAGVAIAALLLSVFAGGAPIAEAHFHPVFIAVGVIEVLSIVGFWRLHPAAGREITGAK